VSLQGIDFFVKLLAGAHANELNFDVFIRPETGDQDSFLARSTISLVPISRTKISPFPHVRLEDKLRGSGIVMKYRLISG